MHLGFLTISWNASFDRICGWYGSVLETGKGVNSSKIWRRNLEREKCIQKFVELVSLSLQEPQVVLGCVQLLQSLSQHKQHLKDLPSKTMTDILTEVTTASFVAPSHSRRCKPFASFNPLCFFVFVFRCAHRYQRRCLRRCC